MRWLLICVSFCVITLYLYFLQWSPSNPKSTFDDEVEIHCYFYSYNLLDEDSTVTDECFKIVIVKGIKKTAFFHTYTSTYSEFDVNFNQLSEELLDTSAPRGYLFQLDLPEFYITNVTTSIVENLYEEFLNVFFENYHKINDGSRSGLLTLEFVSFEEKVTIGMIITGRIQESFISDDSI